jgi:hypothetical protein
MDPKNTDDQPTLSLFSVLFSVLASMFGVQSASKHEADFTHGKPIHYILAGLLVTIVFVLTLWGVVRLVLSFVG